MANANERYSRFQDLNAGPKPFLVYASKDITVSGSTSDYSLRDNTSLFDVITDPLQFLIRNGSQAISFKLNSITADPISLLSNSDFGVDAFVLTDIFVTVSGSGPAALSVTILGWR